MAIVELIIDFLFPKQCVGCGQYETFLCDKCWSKLTKAKQICPMCDQVSFGGKTHEKCNKKWGMAGLTAVFAYRNEVMRKVVEGIKFGFNYELVGEVLRECDFEMAETDLIVPVPLYWYRENWRGFNQAEEIAKVIGKEKVTKALKRVKNTAQQARITDKEKRLENIKEAFQVVSEVGGKRVLLVDDVFTSGASMRECAKELKKAGAKSVWGWVLAR